MDTILSRLQKVFQRTLRQPQLVLSPEMGADDIGGWTSLTNISLIIGIEKEFKIRLSTAEIAASKNIKGLVECVERKFDNASTQPKRATPSMVKSHILSVPRALQEIRLDAGEYGHQEPAVARVFAMAGTNVEIGDPLFDVENSKATHEIIAPVGGMLAHTLSVGDTVVFGTPIALILHNETDGSALAEAVKTLRQFAASRDGRLDNEAASGKALPHDSKVAVSTEHLLPHKLEEIRILSGGAGNTMLSVIGVRLGRLEIQRTPEEFFFADKIVDLVIFEASRLMRKFPKLNARYQKGAIEMYSEIHAGIAFDEGERLVVYGLAGADRKGLQEVQTEIEEALALYMQRKLTRDQLSRATFTVTDISALNMDFAFPILPEAQSSIVGITRNDSGEFALYLGYDHRVTEGLQAAKFLEDLRLRVMSFASRHSTVPRCSFCDKSAAEETSSWRGRGLLKLLDGDGREVLACYSCWSGW